MDFMPEKESDILIRKYRSILSVSGKGVLLFALWSIIKFFIYLFLYDDYFHFSSMDFFTKIITYIVVGFILAIDLLLRFVVYRRTGKVGRGEKNKYKYLFIVVLFIILELAGVIMSFFDNTFGDDPLSYIVSLFISGTSVYVLLEVMIYSLKIRKMEKSLREAPYAA